MCIRAGQEKHTLMVQSLLRGYPPYGKCTLLVQSILCGYSVYGKRKLSMRNVLCGYSVNGKRSFGAGYIIRISCVRKPYMYDSECIM